MSSQLFISAIVLLGLVGQAHLQNTGGREASAPESPSKQQQNGLFGALSDLTGRLPQNGLPGGQQGANSQPQQGLLGGLGNLDNLRAGLGGLLKSVSERTGLKQQVSQHRMNESPALLGGGLLEAIENILSSVGLNLNNLVGRLPFNQNLQGAGMGGFGPQNQMNGMGGFGYQNPRNGMGLQGLTEGLNNGRLPQLNQFGDAASRTAQEFGRSIPSRRPMNSFNQARMPSLNMNAPAPMST